MWNRASAVKASAIAGPPFAGLGGLPWPASPETGLARTRASVASAIAAETGAREKDAAKSERRDNHGADARSDGPGERPAGAKDADGATGGVEACMLEASPDERDRLGKGGRADGDRNRRDDQQEREIGGEAEQSIADRGPGQRQEQRRDARPPVDPAAESGGERDSGERPRGQDGAQQKGLKCA